MPGPMMPCIAIIHATRNAVTAIEDTFEKLWPEAEIISLLDEYLSKELAKVGSLNDAISNRIARLAQFGLAGGADAILYSCSAFGKAIEEARASLDVPVLKPNEAMLTEALAAGSHIRVVATYMPTIASITGELKEMSQESGQKIEIDPCFVPGAFGALESGDGERHDELIAEAMGNRLPCDVVLLSQFSMARALPLVKKNTNTIVLSSPDSAVLNLQDQLQFVRESI
ncbi:MAG: arylsulfatase [Nitrospinaceae bacterium]|nr:arylsulfatase [Nitrospinaceae bacterium]MBT3822403.1 arylsulfatase [Nitrospinaceae bacterium]MBT4094126.1 arylsulfatase [Nitrospinaceae bacterium]MBT4431645.1 arylsulfatase [Nitrospinaceae bacterium]MBT5948368.1 arylsulfatase [Nitrospinaceae bacterium]